EDLSFGSFTTPKLLTAINQVVINSGKFPTVLVSDYATQELYFALLTAQPRYMVAEDSAKTLDGGFRALTFTGGGQPIPWIADRLAPAQTLYMIHEPDIQVFS
ncbi:MAG: hypothetical protein GTN93_34805, partial [Anaerolineae bacterium]|nr:hypothetical protein [Anaerolineae bacterium]